MRVLFLSEIGDPGVGSSVRQTFAVARELQGQGHEPVVAACVRKPEDAGESEVEGVRVVSFHSDYPVRFRPWVSLNNRRVTAPLQALLDDFRPDVAHAHLVHTHLGYHALTQARRAGAGVVFTAHDVMVFCYQKLTCFHGGEEHGGRLFDVKARAAKCIPCQRLRFRPGRNAHIKRVLQRDVHRFHVVSDALGDIIRANDVRVDRTVHNAIELRPSLPNAADVSAFRARYGLTNERTLAIGGRLHEQKGVGKLLEMLARLRPEFPDVRLFVMGRREIWEREFEPQARVLGVADMVVPTDWLGGDELALAYAATDIFVTPSICFDTFGIVNLEAMEHAKPVVATAFGGSCEVIEHGVTGFIENPYDVDAYAEKLAVLLRDRELCERMGQAGRERLLERFTIPRLAAECLEEYDLAQHAARGARA